MNESKNATKLFCQFCFLIICLIIFAVSAIYAQPAREKIFSSSINPDQYIVGPGDKFEIDFLSNSFNKMSVTVSPEGFLQLETMGQVDVGGINLTDAKMRIAQLVKQFYSNEFTIGLTGVKPVRILVSGAVVLPGLYDGFVSNHASEIIDMAGGLTPGASQRNIRIKSDNFSYNVDLVRFNRLGDLEANPYLYSGRHLHIPLVVDSSDFVHISGEVNSSGRFEYKAGDKLIDYIEFAYGLTGFENDRITVFSKNGGEYIINEYDLSEVDRLANPGDKIIVGRKDRAVQADYFTIGGEVNFPGSYPYMEKMYCSDALEIAGGASEAANLYAMSICRNYKDLKAGRDGFSSTLPLSFDREAMIPENLNRMKILPGDSIYIPKKSGIVQVFGKVQNPGSIIFVKPQSVINYIEMAGGFSPDADKESIDMVRGATGSKSTVNKSATVFDGDVIIVNKSENIKSKWHRVKEAFIILGGAALTYLAIDNIAD